MDQLSVALLATENGLVAVRRDPENDPVTRRTADYLIGFVIGEDQPVLSALFTRRGSEDRLPRGNLRCRFRLTMRHKSTFVNGRCS